MSTPAKIAIGVYAAILAGSAYYCAHRTYIMWKRGPHARTPLEAWIIARRHARHIDAEWRVDAYE